MNDYCEVKIKIPKYITLANLEEDNPEQHNTHINTHTYNKWHTTTNIIVLAII